MIRKKIVPLVLAAVMSLSIGLIGCGNNDNATTDKNNNTTTEDNTNLKDDVNDVAEDVKEGTANLFDKVTDDKMDYTADQLRKELDKAGYKLQKVDENDSLFSVDVHTYKINNEKLYIYEYDESDVESMKNDINSITENGTKINGKDVKWEKASHIYKKGRILVIYDGDNSEVLSTLKDTLGNPILG